MSRIYTMYGAGNHADQHLNDQMRELIDGNDLGRVSAGDIVQANMGWSAKPGRIYRHPARTILEHIPDHPEALSTEFVHEGQAFRRPGFRGVARDAIAERMHPKILVIDYEPDRGYDEGVARFDHAWRPFTVAEIDLIARCAAIGKSEMFRHTGRACMAGVWNTPIYVDDERNDWGAVRELHLAAGLDVFVINDYKYATGVQENYELTRRKIEIVREELPGTKIVVAVTSSLNGRSFDKAPTASLLHKALAARRCGVDLAWWTNTSWLDEHTLAAYQEHTNALGGVFGGGPR